jgi:hypothetical protein
VEHVFKEILMGGMKIALKTLPLDLDDAYTRIMLRIEKQGPYSVTTARHVLTWVFYTRRPLRMEELRDALTVEDDDLHGKENPDEAAAILHCCQGFITESAGTVRFSHPEIERWLAREPQFEKLFPESYLASTCLTYLNFKIFEKEIDYDHPLMTMHRLEKRHFYSYAARFWGAHTREAEDNRYVQKTVVAFLSSKAKRDSMLLVRSKGSFIVGQTLLHVIVKSGLTTIFGLVLTERSNENDT